MRDYQAGSIAQLKQLHFYQPQSALQAYVQSLEAHFKEHSPVSAKQARAFIAEQTGIERSLAQIRAFLLRRGMKCRKVGTIPGKADVEKTSGVSPRSVGTAFSGSSGRTAPPLLYGQRAFCLSARAGVALVFYAGLYQGAEWAATLQRPGAWHAVTHKVKVITLTTCTYITSLQVCELLTQLTACAAGLPTTVVLDNARYQRCRLVKAHAAQFGIELLFLPPYSPNLNLIERLWKFVKKQCLYSKYYEKFDPFKAAISDCPAATFTKHKEELKTLLTLKCQTFEEAQIVTV